MQTTITLKVNPDMGESEEMTLTVNGNLTLEQAKEIICGQTCNPDCSSIVFDSEPNLDMAGMYPKVLSFNASQTEGLPVEAQAQAVITKLAVVATSDHLRVEDHNGKAGLVFSKDADPMIVHQVYFPLLSNLSIDQANQRLAPGRFNVLETIESETEVKLVLDTEIFTAGVFTEQGTWSVCLIDPNNVQEVITLNATIPQGESVPINLSQDLYISEMLSIEWTFSYECDGAKTQTARYNFITNQEY